VKPTLSERAAQRWRALFPPLKIASGGVNRRSGRRVAEVTDDRPARWHITQADCLTEQEAIRLENSQWY
jgi:hypothetical protein